MHIWMYVCAHRPAYRHPNIVIYDPCFFSSWSGSVSILGHQDRIFKNAFYDCRLLQFRLMHHAVPNINNVA